MKAEIGQGGGAPPSQLGSGDGEGASSGEQSA